MNRPKLRPIRGFPAQAQQSDGQQVPMIGLADRAQISDRIVFTQPAAMQLLPLLDGSRTIDALIQEVGRGLNRDILEGLVAQLDDAGLLEGPTFEAMLAKMHQQFDAEPILPAGSTVQFAESLFSEEEQQLDQDAKDALAAEKLRGAFDDFMRQALKDASDASLLTLPKAIVAPHLDYPRGFLNYGAVWGRLRDSSRPDRVIILGTNHFGRCTGVCGSNKGYSSPLGVCELDTELFAKVQGKLGADLGSKFIEHRFDHEREHSIELQVPWVQHIFGKDEQGRYPKVLGVLIHDPIINNGESYDGKGVGLEPFCAAVKAAIAELPGTTLVVSSADLAHVGPAFGDNQQMTAQEGPAAEFRQRVIESDLDLLKQFIGSDPNSENPMPVSPRERVSSFIGTVAWQENANRWCSVGNMAAAVLITEPTEIVLLNYAAAIDPQGSTMVSSCAMAMN